jgi:hypothetical protein
MSFSPIKGVGKAKYLLLLVSFANVRFDSLNTDCFMVLPWLISTVPFIWTVVIMNAPCVGASIFLQ